MNLLSPSRYASRGYPWDEWERLRKEAPVKKIEREGEADYWAITRHEDIIAISRDPNTFSSVNGGRIASKEDEISFPSKYQLGPNIFGMDPPVHGQFRALAAPSFGLQQLTTKQTVHRVCRQIFDAHASKEAMCFDVDFVRDVAVPVSVRTLAHALGFSESTAEILTINSNPKPALPDTESSVSRARHRLDQTDLLLDALVEEVELREQSPDRTDLISVLSKCEVNARPLDGPTLLSYCYTLAISGTETTRIVIGEIAKVFVEHPTQWGRLVENPGLIPTAVEELLRWISPVIHFARTVTRPTNLRGQSLATGDWVALFYPSANRDERVFDTPEEFDVGRKPNRHLAFGGLGVHQCLGMHMARLELNALLEFLVARVSAFSLTGDPKRRSGILVGGYSHMPVRVHLQRQSRELI